MDNIYVVIKDEYLGQGVTHTTLLSAFYNEPEAKEAVLQLEKNFGKNPSIEYTYETLLIT